MQAAIFSYPNLDVRAGSVHDLNFDHTKCVSSITGQTWGRVNGVRLGTFDRRRQGKLSLNDLPTDSGSVISCSQVVICTGTFLSGEIHMGRSHFQSRL